MKRDISAGDIVRLTRKFLKNTGQTTGGEAQRRWKVAAIDSARGWAITDQILEGDYFTNEELAADPSLRFRRIALGNLERVTQESR